MKDWNSSMAQAFAAHLLNLGATHVKINGPDMRGAFHFDVTNCPLDRRQLDEERDKFERGYQSE